MRALFRWLRVEKTSRVEVNPSTTVEVALPLSEAFARCAEGVEDALGGVVAQSDPAAGFIEATFGLIHSERILCQCVSLDSARTQIRIVSRRLLGAKPRQHSDYVARLAGYLRG
ncbi:MAG: hypothetical protein M3Y18_02330 [Candidatus Eremiobacteraeota bacterium]|nr:hypothetical protein [Candidatus Eremiobacteraeota bacterium]